MTRPYPRRSRAAHSRELDDGAPGARSALTLRAVLAAFGLVFCAGAAWFGFRAGIATVGWIMVVVAVVALVDLGVVANRKRRGEPG